MTILAFLSYDHCLETNRQRLTQRPTPTGIGLLSHRLNYSISSECICGAVTDNECALHVHVHVSLLIF